MSEKTYYRLSLNYMGQNVLVDVEDLETANILLNDQSEALKFLCSHDPDRFRLPDDTGSQQQVLKELIINKQCSSKEISEPGTSSCRQESRTLQVEKMDEDAICQGNEIWTRKKPTSEDINATEILIRLREEHSKKFDDTTTHKSTIWAKIAQKLNELGYYLGKDPSEKCRQKWTNIVKKYHDHIKHVKSTGTEAKESPPFFDLVHSILGSKDLTTPQNLISSEDTDVNKKEPAEIKNRFKELKRRAVPARSTQNICDVIKNESQRDREIRREEFRKLEEFHHRTIQQRDEFLNIFKQMVSKETTNKFSRVETDET